MTIYYLDLPYIDRIPNAYAKSSSQFMAETGGNIGNLVFRKGLSSIVELLSQAQCITWAAALQSPHLFKDASLVFVSCANWLGTSNQDESANLHRAQVIESFSCPVVSFGLGIQASEGADSINLGPNTIRLAKALSSKYEFLSVRDVITKQCLSEIGIDNTVVTGCPSNFITGPLSPHMFESIMAQHDYNGWDKMLCGFSEVSGGHPDAGQILFSLLGILANSPSKYIIQTPLLMDVLMSTGNDLPHIYLKCSPFDSRRTINVLRDKSCIFTSVDEWLFTLRRFSLTLGMRIHGSMTSLQAAVPSVLVYHDSRTLGLAEAMQVPRISTQDMLRFLGGSPVDLVDYFRETLPEYLSQRRVLSEIMLDYLKPLKLPSTRHLESIIAQ